jgi:hypothetical protein
MAGINPAQFKRTKTTEKKVGEVLACAARLRHIEEPQDVGAAPGCLTTRPHSTH